MSGRVAIVGLACRYPEASSPLELWLNLLARRRSFRRLPEERLPLADYGTRDPGDPDRTYLSRAAVIENWSFDRARFRVSRATYESTDPAHWLALEVAGRALEDAGFTDGRGAPAEGTGVLVGNSLTGEFSRANGLRLRWPHARRALETALHERPDLRLNEEAIARLVSDVERSFKSPFPEQDEDSLAGALSNTIAGRICNHHDFHGGGYTVDGACASSLLAVADAASKLVAGDLDLALAGGVDLSLDPLELVGFARLGALARDEMRVHDRRPTGFLPGEGCGFVVLMREEDARREGRPIRALISGWGISSDGRGGLTRPEADGQLLALERACRRAGLAPQEVTYHETHGTGTAAGDAAELAALQRLRGEQAPPAYLGSLKANIGHAKAAAGIAGLLKAVVAVNRGILPPSTGCTEPREELSSPTGVLRTLRRGAPWPADRPRLAGVSAMGFGGINAHVVVDGRGSEALEISGVDEARALRSWQDSELLLFAGRDRAELAAQIERARRLAGRLSAGELADLAGRLHRELDEGEHRAAVVASAPESAEAGLARLASELESGADSILDPRRGCFLGLGPRDLPITLLFPGQGSRPPGDAGLAGERFACVEEEHASSLPPGRLEGGGPGAVQAAVVSASLAGLRLLRRLGIEADAAVGHSLGELVALHWAGSFDRDTLLRLVRARAEALGWIPGDPGAMAAVAAPASELRDLVDEELVVACLNGERETTLAGPSARVAAAVAELRARGLAAVSLDTTHGFHSPCVAPARDRFLESLTRESLKPPSRSVVSTVTAASVGAGTDLRALLADQLSRPVLFARAVERLASDTGLFVEVGADAVLSGLVRRAGGVPAAALAIGGASLAGPLAVAGACFVAGRPVRLEALFEERHLRPIDLDRPPSFLVNPCEKLTRSPRAVGAAAPPPRAAGEGARKGDEQPVAPDEEPLEILSELIAKRAGLPRESLDPGLRLLSDLHLNSLSAARLVAEAATLLGAAAPPALELADATLTQVAGVLEGLRSGARRGVAAPRSSEGLGAWVRAFIFKPVEDEPRVPVKRSESGVRWSVVAGPGDALAQAAGAAAARPGETTGVLVSLTGDDAADLALLLQGVAELRGAAPGSRFAVVSRDRPVSAFVRTAHLELQPEASVVLDLAPGAEPAAEELLVAAEGGSGFRELRWEADGRRSTSQLVHLEASGTRALEPPIGPDDVVLVTGGARGIAAECALELARRSGAALALLGRGRPEEDAELAAALRRFGALGSPTSYAAADVTDRGAVERALEQLQGELGSVTVFVHAAGHNRPARLAELDEAAVREALAPKVEGARHVLELLDPRHLRAFVPFGSIIGRMGLEGEAHYALANERLRKLAEEWQQAHPSCRCTCVEWSAWSGVGMAERLAGVGLLAERGVTAIPPSEGADRFCRLLAEPPESTAVLVTGRWGAPEALPLPERELPLLRFVERPRLHVPGVELVVDAELGLRSDPYLDDHVLDDQRLLPAVLGLEAMAQVAAALAGGAAPTGFRDVRFDRPVTLAADGTRLLRLAALGREDGDVEIALRSAETGFAADHFRARCVFADDARDESDAGSPELDEAAAVSSSAAPVLESAENLYGALLFQSGRFRRLTGYRELSSRGCAAELGEGGARPWFGRYLPQSLLLPDPGGRDALLHAIQACHPHATLLPVAVDRIQFCTGRDVELRRVRSVEVAARPPVLVHDVEALDAGGRVVERWQGLQLREVEGSERGGAQPAALAGAVAERRFADFFSGAQLSVRVTESAGREAERSRSSPSGPPAASRADGRPARRDGLFVARAHGASCSVEVTAASSVGCDLEPARGLPESEWPALLGPDREGLVREAARVTGEAPELAATRLWCVLECLRKADLSLDTPLVLGEAGRQGWLSMRAGSARVACGPLWIEGRDEPDYLALLQVEK